MKRTILSMAAVICCISGVYAQTDVIATLNHGSSITTFFGEEALSEAYEAAAEGDVITLSPGVFHSVNIEKAITVRGAGMMPLESNGYVATHLSGGFNINVPESSSSSILTIEGVLALDAISIYGSDLAPLKFIKSRFEGGVYGYGVFLNAAYCVFTSYLKAVFNSNGVFKSTTFNCMNCIIETAGSDGLASASSKVAKIQATNCVLEDFKLHYSTLSNCLILSSTGSSLDNTCSVHNCYGLYLSGSSNLFEYINDKSNKMLEGTDIASIFKTLTNWSSGSFLRTETFELTDEAAATYLGDDGKQVGIYGGPAPFDPVPTNPQVKKFVVDSSTESGKLKVKINVE